MKLMLHCNMIKDATRGQFDEKLDLWLVVALKLFIKVQFYIYT